MSNPRKICVVTGARAEYGLLYWLLKDIQTDANLKLQVVATGMHLAPEFGLTYKVIEQDGFHIDAKVEMLLSSDTPVGIAKSIGLGIMGFADAFEYLKPDVLVLLGDRYEVFAAAQAALVARIPIAHLHGGEATEGVIDESIRHSITKMSQWHFVAAEEYRQRVIQLGEAPERVFNVGALGVDNIKRSKLLSKQEFQKAFGFEFGKQNFLVTYHPVTLRRESSNRAVTALLQSLDRFPEAKIIFTQPNADTDGRVIAQRIQQYVEKRSDRAVYLPSLGRIGYISALEYVEVIVGNSSSGITEAPTMKKATVNLGARQRGRLKADSVVDCEETLEAICAALGKALSQEFQCSLKNVSSPYGNGNASRQIKEYLERVELSKDTMKEFYDLVGER